MAKTPMQDYERVIIESRAELRSWLMENHTRRESVWLVTYKKAAGGKYVPYRDVVDEALCFGWIDSLPRKLDAERSMLLLSPRRAGGNWSRINKEKAARLIEAGLMTEAGFAAIERAKRDGTWDALSEVDALSVPADLAAALLANPAAKRRFDNFPPSSRRGILEWINAAKRPETREKRIVETVALAAGNIKANHPDGRNRGLAQDDP